MAKKNPSYKMRDVNALMARGFLRTEAIQYAHSPNVFKSPVFEAYMAKRDRQFKLYMTSEKKKGHTEKEAKANWARRIKNTYRGKGLAPDNDAFDIFHLSYQPDLKQRKKVTPVARAFRSRETMDTSRRIKTGLEKYAGARGKE